MSPANEQRNMTKFTEPLIWVFSHFATTNLTHREILSTRERLLMRKLLPFRALWDIIHCRVNWNDNLMNATRACVARQRKTSGNHDKVLRKLWWFDRNFPFSTMRKWLPWQLLNTLIQQAWEFIKQFAVRAGEKWHKFAWLSFSWNSQQKLHRSCSCLKEKHLIPFKLQFACNFSSLYPPTTNFLSQVNNFEICKICCLNSSLFSRVKISFSSTFWISSKLQLSLSLFLTPPFLFIRFYRSEKEKYWKIVPKVDTMRKQNKP